VTDPKGKVVSGTTSSSTSTEKYGSGSTSAPAGVLGITATSTGSNTTTNTTGTAAGTGTATGAGGVNGANTGTSSTTTNGNGGYTKTTKDEQYALGKQSVTTTQGPGTLKSLHVAVLVDSAAKPNIATITKLANTTAGITAKRGDSLTVVQMPFSTSAAKAAKTAATAAAKAKSASATTGLIRLVVAVLGVLAMIVLLLRSTKRERREEIVMPLERLDQLALPSGSSMPALPSPRTQAAAGELAHLIEEAPDEVAKVLRSWMHERSGRH
jgi:flagellar M-ring protein FliF